MAKSTTEGLELNMTAALTRPILPPAIQGQLGLRDPRFRPLSTAQTVLRDLGELDVDVAHISELGDAGVLIRFNIALHLNSKAEWRYLTRSVHFFQNAARDGKRNLVCHMDWGQIFRLICPHQKPVVTGLEMRRAMACHKTHVQHLIDANELVPTKKSQPGPGGSWVVTRESYENFLKGRMQ